MIKKQHGYWIQGNGIVRTIDVINHLGNDNKHIEVDEISMHVKV